MIFYYPNTISNITDTFRQLLLLAPHVLENYFIIPQKDAQVRFVDMLENMEPRVLPSFNYFNTANNMTDGFCRRLLQSPEEVVLFFKFTNSQAQELFMRSVRRSLEQRNTLNGSAAKVLLVNFYDDAAEVLNAS